MTAQIGADDQELFGDPCPELLTKVAQGLPQLRGGLRPRTQPGDIGVIDMQVPADAPRGVG